jgi:hypothetical protein
MTDIKKYFHDMRFDESGDVRLTIAEQEDLISKIEGLEARLEEAMWRGKDSTDRALDLAYGLREHLKVLKGTGCATVEELRKKCDWAMDAIYELLSSVQDDWGHCHFCRADQDYSGDQTIKHRPKCMFTSNWYDARIE